MGIIDGHFWLELPNGKIIDHLPFWIEDTKEIMEVSDPIYMEAPMWKQKEMIVSCVERKKEEYAEVGITEDKIEEVFGLRDGFCHVNVTINQLKYPDGVIKYGSFGWRNKKTGKSYLEYDWTLNDEKAAKRGRHPFEMKLDKMRKKALFNLKGSKKKQKIGHAIMAQIKKACDINDKMRGHQKRLMDLEYDIIYSYAEGDVNRIR
jgi:hypothetical protein